MAGPAIFDRTTAYRREARRIRGRLADCPVERYSALRELSRRQDATHSQSDPPAAVVRSPATTFGQIAARQIHDGVLPYSRRLGLLGTAQELGVGRFEANLIIAAVQHRTGAQPASGPASATFRLPIRRALPLLTVLLVQSLILAGLWGIFLR
jgi:hypothetical protein